MGRRWWLALAVLAAMGGAACVSGPGPDGRATLRVENTNWTEVTVYAIDGDNVEAPLRLGEVEPFTTRTLSFRPSVMANRFLIRLFAMTGDPYLTERVLLGPGDQVTLRVGQPLPFTAITKVDRTPPR